jgi:hypothetical protein
MLLGPGSYLQYRQKVRLDLLNMGYKRVLIMEDLKRCGHGGINEKFEWIIREYDPRLFVAFFHKESHMDAVIFEIGCLLCKFGSQNIGKKLRFIFEKGFDDSSLTTAYIKDLLSNVARVYFDELEEHHRSAELIRTFIVSG